MEDQQILELQQLAEELNIRDPRKLYQAAVRREYRDVSLQQAKQALRGDVARQLLAPAPRSLGKSAASGPDRVLQADLIDFAQNARSASGARYALLLVDVYTREIAAELLVTKNPAEVNRALQNALQSLISSSGNYIISTDKGGEFSQIQQVLPQGTVHRLKQGTNDIAVVDRAMQTLKRDLAAIVARQGGKWDEALQQAVDAYNERPHEAVFGPPEDVDKEGTQDFLVLRKNARAFMQNRAISDRRKSALEEAGAFRAPVQTGGRSFNPRYGGVRVLERIEEGAQFVFDDKGNRTLLKEAEPIPVSSAAPVGRLTDPQLGVRMRFQTFARQLKRLIESAGGSMQVSELPIGSIPNMRNALRQWQMSVVGFLNLFKDVFTQERGVVTLTPVRQTDEEALEVERFTAIESLRGPRRLARRDPEAEEVERFAAQMA